MVTRERHRWLLAAGSALVLSVAAVDVLRAEGMLSAGNPILVDDDGDGPDEGDRRIYALSCGYRPGSYYNSNICMTNPWQSCYDATGDKAELVPHTGGVVAGNEIADGFERTSAVGYQSAVVSELDENYRPSEWQFVDVEQNKPTQEGRVQMIDADGDARYEYVRIEELVGNPAFPTMLLGLIGADTNNDNFPDYASLEWSVQNASTWGIRDCPQEGVGPGDPIWVPVARDFDGDAAVMLDLDDNGQLDSEFLIGPKLALGARVVPIPTLGEWALLGLGAALMGAGLRRVRQVSGREPSAPPSAAA